MRIQNQPELVQDELVNKLRGAIIHRAMWMGLILKEVQERGHDWEEIGHAAIFKTGCMHGEGIKDRMGIPGNLVSFGNTFFTEDIKKVFEITVKQIDEDELRLEYGHCPLVTAWQQLGFEGEMLEKLCDIAMSGDRGISNRFESFEFKLGRTIAQGHKVCEVCFTRRKPSP
jgi:hypothetical protein